MTARFLILFLLLAGLVMPANSTRAQLSSRTVQPSSRTVLADANRAYTALAARVNPSVVQVFTRRYRRPEGRRGASTYWAERQVTGSGVVVDSTGYIVTNAHVVEGAHAVQVRPARPAQRPAGEASILRPRRALLDATIVGVDTETDLAVLKVDGNAGPPLSFANSDRARPGELVFAFGSPRGLPNSVSRGVVSATARQLRPGDPMIYIQTDAPINPGSSGGPLVNVNGDIVGINTLILSESGGSDGIGFAAPSNIVKAVVHQIRAHGHVRRGVVGVHAQTLSPELSRILDVDSSYRVVLSDVLPDSPADRAGLRPGDVITHLNGKRMENGRQFDVNLYGVVGTRVSVRGRRDGSPFETLVRVVERPDPKHRFARRADPDEHRVDRLSVLALPLTPSLAEAAGIARSLPGVLIAASDGPTTPWGAHLKPGDVLSLVNGTPVRTPSNLREVLQPTAPGECVLAHVLRNGRMQFLVLRVQ